MSSPASRTFTERTPKGGNQVTPNMREDTKTLPGQGGVNKQSVCVCVCRVGGEWVVGCDGRRSSACMNMIRHRKQSHVLCV